MFLYIGFLFLIGLWVERRSVSGGARGNHPLVYSLSLAIYCTTWTYYGSVGNAATSGMFFLTIYLGPTLMIILWWTILRKLVRLKNSQHITSIADFIAARYGKSQLLAALATIIALVGTVPYIALQLKAVINTFAIITTSTGPAFSWIGDNVGPIVVALMTVFTIIFGVRRLDPTERHQGIVVVVAVESLVKLVTFLAVGIFITYFVFNGFEDIFEHFHRIEQVDLTSGQDNNPSVITWATYMILSMSAIMFLPRQFHISVVENSDENHIRTAMWLFPLYMFLINIFVLPIAKAGILTGLPIQDADTYVLAIPLHYDKPWLALAVFIGGFSAATSMIMISAMTLSTMCTNHLLLPVIDLAHELSFLRRHLLGSRWVAVGMIILSSYWFERIVGPSFSLVRMGIISFTAALQFAPVILGGIFWRRGNKYGAMLGLGAGLILWIHTLIVPSFVKSGWANTQWLESGPWGIGILNPEQLFGLSGLDTMSHAVLWSMFFNIGLYVLGSLCCGVKDEEKRQADNFVDVLSLGTSVSPTYEQTSYVDLEEKKVIINALLCQYFPVREAGSMLKKCMAQVKIKNSETISVLNLADLCNAVEKSLAGTIGSAAAYNALKRKIIFTPAETKALQDAYGEILASLSLTPEDLKKKVDYYKDRENLITTHAEELQEKLIQLKDQIRQRKLSEEALRDSEERLQAILDNTSAIIYLKDTEGKYILINQQFTKIFNVKAEETIGKTDHEIFAAEIATQFWTNDRLALAENRLCQMEETIPQDDGLHYYLSVKFPLYDHATMINGICGISTDITALKKAESQLRRLSGSIMDSQEKERSAIARELHDELGQILTALRLDSKWIQNRLQNADNPGSERAQSMTELIDKTIDEVRGMATRLRPGVLDDLGLIDALEWLTNDLEKRSEFSCTFSHNEVPQVSDAIATAAYRITQEALTNVTRHSGATQVDVALRYQEGALTLAIQDNGQGFDMQKLEESEGLGVTGMKERATLIGGNVAIDSQPGLGTTVYVQIPTQLTDGVLHWAQIIPV
ncbi:MAG: PAS domain-containing protein [Proteobacteria bacterium]|nr:PAS domain-containing protein [Pseudomonadota bacterium]MBU1710001.1 PAS domain-containing protein [Pseudomonadota bacterium]